MPRLCSWPALTMSLKCWISIRTGYTFVCLEFLADGSGATMWKCPTTSRMLIWLPTRNPFRLPPICTTSAAKSRRLSRVIGLPLRGKTVKIVTVEKTDESVKDDGPQLRLGFAKSVLDKSYSEIARNPQGLDGIVLIFDSADGGMIAATLPTLQQWKAGTLSDAALWHQCFFDPPESFTASAAGASQ